MFQPKERQKERVESQGRKGLLNSKFIIIIVKREQEQIKKERKIKDYLTVRISQNRTALPLV